MAAAGVPPRIMGIGPVPATRKLMARLGHKIDDYAVIELNEAFASQSLACLRQLGLADDAAQSIRTAARSRSAIRSACRARAWRSPWRTLARNGGKLGLATMCVGVGQGVSLGAGTGFMNQKQ